MLLAQFNVARLLVPLEAVENAEFVANLELVNTAAESAPGFVWRHKAEGRDDATTIRPFADSSVITNLSVWESVEHLEAFVASKAHRPFLLRRRDWFDASNEANNVMWWIPQLHVPTLDEAIGRLDLLRAHGPSERAFDFRHPFPP